MHIDLFNNKTSPKEHLIPVAERCRPKHINDVIGHSEILGTNSILSKSIQNGRLISCIFWGPPGVGKTTISRLITQSIDAHFISLSAVTSGVKDLRTAIEKAKFNLQTFSKMTVVFIDEIHRFNKSQQDALLHSVENGDIILIGATTENPSFEVNSALLSRLQVFKLDPLTKSDLSKIVQNALATDQELTQLSIEIIDEDILIELSCGDARKCLTILESSVLIQNQSVDKIVLTKSDFIKAAQSIKSTYDKSGDNHYDTISAFIKSIRGSDPDAAVFWLARMIDGGEDPVFIARRLIISASEDIGNADPTALILAVNGLQAVQAIGFPEAQIVLSQVTTYLASTFKSNAAYMAIKKANTEIEKSANISVPLHLRNAATPLMKQNDYGLNYKYPHDYDQNFIKQGYFPEHIKNKAFYSPTENGRETIFKERLNLLWNRNR